MYSSKMLKNLVSDSVKKLDNENFAKTLFMILFSMFVELYFTIPLALCFPKLYKVNAGGCGNQKYLVIPSTLMSIMLKFEFWKMYP